MRNLFTILLSVIPFFLWSQSLFFNFDNLDLLGWEQTDQAIWDADTLLPITGAGSLHHVYDNSESGIDVIAYNFDPLLYDSTEFILQFKVKYDYNPSGGNNWSVCLSRSCGLHEINSSGAMQGYVLGVNYTGSSDFIQLWHQDKNSAESILSSSFNWQDNIAPGQVVLIKLTRSINSLWEVFVDTTLTNNFVSIGSVNDTRIKSAEQFVVYYKYTSTQDQKLWLDDLTISGRFFKDTVAPGLAHYKVVSPNVIRVSFSEPVDTTSTIKYVLSRSEQPKKVVWDGLSDVLLEFEDYFQDHNLIEIYNLSDLKGNKRDFLAFNFLYYHPQVNDVLINEIMADPMPEVELPDCEYIELLNRTESTIDITNWQIVSGDRTPGIFPTYEMTPHSYLLVIDDGCKSNFDNINVLRLSNLPTLPNSGESIKLIDRSSAIINHVTYSDNWYADDIKSEGGWSLELSNPDYSCITTNNWKASLSQTGGTPGQVNSVFGTLDEYPVCRLQYITSITDTGMLLRFTEPVDSITSCDIKNYNISPSNITLQQIITLSRDHKEVYLKFSEVTDSTEIFTLTFSDELVDCAGLAIENASYQFGFPCKIDSSSVVINEILFEASDEVPEFIELYNPTQSVFNLKDLQLVSLDPFSDTIIKTLSFASEGQQFFPGTYLVLAENSRQLLEVFPVEESNIQEPQGWINLVNSGGLIGLISTRSKSIDKAVYSLDMHFSLLSSTRGVSLERIDVNQPGYLTGNWHSAASVADYATPGRENSQSGSINESTQSFSLEPKEISPDNDGHNDYTDVIYNFKQEGYSCSVKIFNVKGVLVKELANNELAGVSGYFRWDGLDNYQSRLSMGYYIVLCEAWHPEGDVIKQKKVVVMLPEE